MNNLSDLVKELKQKNLEEEFEQFEKLMSRAVASFHAIKEKSQDPIQTEKSRSILENSLEQHRHTIRLLFKKTAEYIEAFEQFNDAFKEEIKLEAFKQKNEAMYQR